MEIQTGKFELVEMNLHPTTFKGNWSQIEIAGVKAMLTSFLTEEFGEIIDSNSFFGFKFTNHGHSEMAVQSPEVTIEGNSLKGFMILTSNVLVARCVNANGEQLFYQVL